VLDWIIVERRKKKKAASQCNRAGQKTIGEQSP